mmetsp:Transcript_72796/g.152046  ORF Transcript_72796/g.152046 Transcript_72796/m.152046 type:complete len:244 (-) Transcript_72796:101-832(-)
MSWGVPVWLAGKDTLDHGFEKREWQALIVGIERRLVVLEAEPLTGIKVRAVAELLPHVVINPCLLAIVKHLEYLVVLRDPSHLRLNIWRKQRRRHLPVIRRREQLPNVVEQRHHHEILLLPSPVRSRRRLKPMRVHVDRSTELAVLSLLPPQHVQHPRDLVRFVVSLVQPVHQRDFRARARCKTRPRRACFLGSDTIGTTFSASSTIACWRCAGGLQGLLFLLSSPVIGGVSVCVSGGTVSRI